MLYVTRFVMVIAGLLALAPIALFLVDGASWFLFDSTMVIRGWGLGRMLFGTFWFVVWAGVFCFMAELDPTIEGVKTHGYKPHPD